MGSNGLNALICGSRAFLTQRWEFSNRSYAACKQESTSTNDDAICQRFLKGLSVRTHASAFCNESDRGHWKQRNFHPPEIRCFCLLRSIKTNYNEQRKLVAVTNTTHPSRRAAPASLQIRSKRAYLIKSRIFSLHTACRILSPDKGTAAVASVGSVSSVRFGKLSPAPRSWITYNIYIYIWRRVTLLGQNGSR